MESGHVKALLYNKTAGSENNDRDLFLKKPTGLSTHVCVSLK